MTADKEMAALNIVMWTCVLIASLLIQGLMP